MQSRHGSLESAVLSALWNLEQSGEYKNSFKEVFQQLRQKMNDINAASLPKS